MALTKVGKEGITGVSNASNATFLTATAAEGVTLAGTLAVTGVHTVGTNAVATSEGGAATSIISQGLAKVWTQFNGTSTVALVDSFNIGSLTDRGTGDYDLAFTNDMAGNTWAAGMNGSLNRSAGVTHCVITGQDSAAGILNVRCDRNNGTGADFTHVEAIICGDLA